MRQTQGSSRATCNVPCVEPLNQPYDFFAFPKAEACSNQHYPLLGQCDAICKKGEYLGTNIIGIV